MARKDCHAAPVDFMDITEVEELEPPAPRQLVATYMGVDPGTRNCGVAIARFYHTPKISGKLVQIEWEFHELDFENDYKNIPGSFSNLLLDCEPLTHVFVEQQYPGGSSTMVSCMQCIYGSLAMFTNVTVVHWSKVIKLLGCCPPEKKERTLEFVRKLSNYPSTLSQHEADAAIQILACVDKLGRLLV